MFCFAKPLRNSPLIKLNCVELWEQLTYSLLDELEIFLVRTTLEVSAFKNRFVYVAWNLKNRWHNTMNFFRKMNCVVSHIHREGNQVADLLLGHGLSLHYIFHWNEAPDFLRDSIVKHILGLSCFKFCNFWWSFDYVLYFSLIHFEMASISSFHPFI
jgi:hypothetical protein